ncbi:O-unit flippase-like protein [Vibrio cholerae]|uniref:O-unit flippase-like protein n=1 Tax=Vibrio cholerae TaxID=666 RepID=UPI00301C195F
MKQNSAILAMISQGLNVAFGLILIPIFTFQLNDYYLGMWFIFFTASALNQILEIGFMPNLARSIAYVLGGANEINKEGLPKNVNSRYKVNRKLLCTIICASRRIYTWVTIISCMIMYVVGSFYIYTLYDADKSISFSYDMLSYLVFISASILNLYFNYSNSVILGFGDVDENNKTIAFSKVLTIIFCTLGSFFGLLGISFCYLFSVLISRMYCVWVYKQVLRKNELYKSDFTLIEIKEIKEVILTVRYNSIKIGLSQVSAFLIVRFNIFVAASVFGVAESSSFSLMISILSTLSSISSVFLNIDLQNISYIQVKNNKLELIDRMGKRIVQSLTCYVFVFLVFHFVGRDILQIISNDSILPETNILLFAYMVFFLELNHVLSATCITTYNKVPFVKSGIISGVVIAILSIILSNQAGLMGLVLSQFIVQIMYNNWKWPRVLSNLLGLRYRKLILIGLLSLINDFKCRRV